LSVASPPISHEIGTAPPRRARTGQLVNGIEPIQNDDDRPEQ
jgi:hypothetical protein